MKHEQPQQVFRNFKIATFAPAGAPLVTPLLTGLTGEVFQQPATTCGQLEDAVIGVANGHILWIIPERELPELDAPVESIDGMGRWLTPGLIDCHTHLVYAGNRAREWEQRLRGTTYEQIARQGGGILSSVRATRRATEDELLHCSLPRLQALMREGVTTVEIKSGYGLDLSTELKMLKVARQLQAVCDVRVESTLLAAHAVPPEFSGRADDYISHVCNDIIPAAVQWCTAVDAFCETIAFDVAQTIRVFEAAKKQGLRFKVHAEQLSHTGIAAAAAKMGAVSADHLEYLSSADCQVLGQHHITATILPGAFYFLKETQKPPVESLRENAVPMAVATDCNPGSSPVNSILLMANMACNLFGLSVEESLQAVTVNAAKALGLEQEIGSLQPGHRADFAVWDVGSPAEIIYEVGRRPCVDVYLAGKRRSIES